jgi:hypothetical protein
LVVTLQTVVVTYVSGDKAEIQPGTKIFVVAKKQADGTFLAAYHLWQKWCGACLLIARRVLSNCTAATRYSTSGTTFLPLDH